MKNGWLYAFLIWITSVLVGSFFTTLYIGHGDRDGFASIFDSFLLVVFYSGLNSIPTVIIFSLGLEFLSTYNLHTNKRFVIICTYAYILCFITLYMFFFDRRDLAENLVDPSFWVIFSCYSLGLTSGIFGFSKWFILNPSTSSPEV